MYQALYRVWRPKTFSDMVGQENIVRTLRNQVTTGRIAHAYLFCGSRGTGKTSAAKIMARAINCLNPQNGDPCGECASCKTIESDASFDVYEMDAASNSRVEEIRELLEKVDDCSYNVVGMVKSYLWERQQSYIQMVQDLVNISLNEELSKKKSELEKLIQTIQSKGEEREKALNDAKTNLEKTKKLMEQGTLLQVQLESGENAKIDMEKV